MGGMSQEEVDELSITLERLLKNDDVDDREVVLFALKELPDSEYGGGEFSIGGAQDE